MKETLTLALSAFLFIAVCPATEAKPFNFEDLLSTAVDFAKKNMYVLEEMELLGHYCIYTRRGYFYKWELNYKAEVKCPGWTGIVGKAKNYVNPTTAEREATKDFVRRALAAGLVNEDEARHWL